MLISPSLVDMTNTYQLVRSTPGFCSLPCVDTTAYIEIVSHLVVEEYGIFHLIHLFPDGCKFLLLKVFCT